MTDSPKAPVIALEEHYMDPLVAADRGTARRPWPEYVASGLADLGELRLREMDEAGIDVQVLSHVSSPVQQVDPKSALDLAIGGNDRLAEAIARHPDRFAGFAALPTPDPEAAASELERCVIDLGFKGAMIHGRSQGRFHDHERFWPIYERAEALDVPIYLHPGPPHPAVVEAYFADYLADFPGLMTAAWGFTIDTANQAMRMVLSGVFERFPDLNVIVGHLGEGLPFLLDRMDESLKRDGRTPIEFKRTFCEHFYVTTSGFFSTPALLCTILQMGIDRVLFSVDWPFMENMPGMDWMETVPLSERDKRLMYSGNAQRLLKM